MFEPIIVNPIYNERGDCSHLRLEQAGRYINIPLAATDIDVLFHNYKWNNLKKIVEDLREKVNAENPIEAATQSILQGRKPADN